MKKVNVMLVIGTAILAVALAGCTGDSTPTSTSTATSKSTYSSSSSSKSSTSTKSDYHSGKGSEWDKQVNDIADEYGDDMGLSAEEIDAMERLADDISCQGHPLLGKGNEVEGEIKHEHCNPGRKSE